ncbi:MAG: hypothetical protein ACK4VK_04025 [Aquificaceae bacterium]
MKLFLPLLLVSMFVFSVERGQGVSNKEVIDKRFEDISKQLKYNSRMRMFKKSKEQAPTRPCKDLIHNSIGTFYEPPGAICTLDILEIHNIIISLYQP